MSEGLSYKDAILMVNRKLDSLNDKLDKFTDNNDHSHQILFDKINEVHIQATKTNGRVNRIEDVVERQEMDIEKSRKEIHLNTNSRIKRTAQWAFAGSLGGVIAVLIDMIIKLIK